MGTGFGIFNRLSLLSLNEEHPSEIALSKELSERELENKLSERELENIRSRRAGIFAFAGGSIKVMELGHCPFGKTCSACDRRSDYCMTDESGRKFPLLRYENSACRFEVYNSANLVSELMGNRLYDFSALSDAEKRAYLFDEELKTAISERTSGALKRGTQ